MKYQCVDSFSSGSVYILAGTIWERDMSDNRIIGGDVKLDNPETMEWLEIPFSTFERCFRKEQ